MNQRRSAGRRVTAVSTQNSATPSITRAAISAMRASRVLDSSVEKNILSRSTVMMSATTAVSNSLTVRLAQDPLLSQNGQQHADRSRRNQEGDQSRI